ncbi:MAG: M20 family metallopeptidase [Bacillota bacterium]
MIASWAKKISDFVDGKTKEMLLFLEEIINTDSHSLDRAGVNRVGQSLAEKFREIGYDLEIRPQRDLGDHIFARNKKGAAGKKILLLGHRDTVFLPGTTSDFRFRIDGDRAYGPAVSDMKGGLVVMIYALWAIKQLGLNEPEIETLITPDEEIGSPSSRKVIEEAARNAMAVFSLEAGRPDGSVVTGRKGSGHLEIMVTGKAAHSGVAFEKGISAIEELARKITALHRLTDLDRGMTVNVGVIWGGTNTNTVAGMAGAKVHFCFNSVEDGETLLTRIKEIALKPDLEGTTGTLSGGITFLPMTKTPGNAKLFEIVQEAGKMYGVNIHESFTKGAADAGFTSAMGVPTICGMGPVGGHWHTTEEYMEVPSLAARTKILALSVLMAAREKGNF